MLRTKTAGSTALVQRTPAWWIVTHCGTWRRESGMGSGVEPHWARVTMFCGRGTRYWVQPAAREKTTAARRRVRCVFISAHLIAACDRVAGHVPHVAGAAR